MKLSAGWLSPDATTNGNAALYHDVVVPRVSAGTIHDAAGAVFSTRIEEYGHVSRALEFWPRGKLLDASAGMNEEIHVMSYIAANQGFDVVAIDADARALQMPAHVGVKRVLGDISLLPFADASFDVYFSVSVIEHMLEAMKALTFHEAKRVLKPGGLLLLTTDETEPEALNEMLSSVGFSVGPVEPFNSQHLTPRVAWAIAQKPL